MIFWMMIDHAQNEATISISITSFTIRVARAYSAHSEKSISCAIARVSASICLLFCLWPCWPALLRGKLAEFKGESQHEPHHAHQNAVINARSGGYSPVAGPGGRFRSNRQSSPARKTRFRLHAGHVAPSQGARR